MSSKGLRFTPHVSNLMPYILLLLLLAPLLFAPEWRGSQTMVIAQDPPPIAGPGWQMSIAEQVTPEQSRQILETRGAALTPLATSTSETEATPEILNLARALKNDPKLIFDYVHNTIHYLPIYGSLNGATATMYAGRGNDWDQVSLFIALMRAAGYQARYVVGDVTYPTGRLANWVGMAASEVQNAFQNGGVPWAWGSEPNTVRITRVWATAQIGGTWYVFDPAMKEYQDTAGLNNLGSVLSYNQATFMSRAQSGATITADSAQNINEANIRTDLTTYGANLVNYLRTNLPTANAAQVIGGRNIVLSEITGYATALPYGTVYGTPQTMDAISNAYRHTMRVQYGGIDRTFFTYEISARRTTIFYNDAGGGNYIPVLRVDAMPIVTGTSAISGTTKTMTVTVDHPYAGSGGTFADQTAWFSLAYGRGSYALVHDFNTVSPLLIARHNSLLGQALFQGQPNTSEAVLGGSLWAAGLSWMHQVNMYDAMVDRLNRTLSLTHHRVGVVGQQEGFFIDVPLAYASGASTDGTTDIFLSARVQTMLDSAFEHGILKQLQEHSGFDSVSTVRMLQFSNSQNTKTFLAKSSNWSSVRSQLTDYDPSDLSWFDTLIGAGYELVLPQDGDQAVDLWSGVGYIQRYESGGSSAMGMIINGGYGGYTSKPVTVDSGTLQDWQQLWNEKSPLYTPKSKDPVNMLTGAFLYDRTDLTVGPGQEPLGLSFSRAYNSQGAYSLGPLGYGWTHNYQWTASLHSNADAGLGTGSGVNAAALVAYTHVAMDVLKNQLNVQGWTTAAVATKWAMDQLLDNAVTIQANDQASTFIRLADGTYNPPVSTGDVLTVDGAGYHLQDRFGAQYEFDLAGKITSWKDANSNTMSFAYNGLSQLTQVTDAFGNVLTLSYTGNLLTSVSNAGRTVGLAYTGNQLTACTDPGGAVWRYVYDADNRMTHVRKANSTTIALTANIYDEFGRVITQTDALNNSTVFYFSGYRNTEKFPDGGEVVYFFSMANLFFARQDQAGTRTTFSYNGLGQLTGMTDRLLDTLTFTYHPQTGRLAAVTNGRGKITTYTYALRSGSTTLYDLSRIDHPDGAYEQFTYDSKGNLLTWRDAGGGTWTYTYNAHGQVLTVQSPTGGAVSYAYNADGTLASSTDSDAGAGTMTYSYDAHKRVAQVNYPGAANEQFVYDANDHLTHYTDRLGAVYTYTFDASGNLTGLTSAQGLGIAQNETYQYDDMNRRTVATDPAGQPTQFAYNNLGSLQQITYPGGAAVTLGYDSRRWIDRITDAAGYVWQATRDVESVFSSVTTPEGRLIDLGSDDVGSYTQITDAQNKTVSAERDAMDRVIKITDRLNRTTTIGRDSAGNITSMSLPVIGTMRYTRNLLGQVTRITDPLGKNWDFAYTPMGRISQITDPKSNTWAYAYDALGRVSTITYPDTVIETRSYDANDNLTGRQFTGGLNLTFAYDALGRLIQTGSAPVTVTYDNRSSIVNTQMGGANWGATYNARGWVESVTYDGQMTVSYAYDARGLLTQVNDTKTGSWIKLGYDKDSLLIKLERSNGVTTDITRDGNGRITKIKHGDKGEMSLTYDAEDQITQIIESLPLDVTSFISPELIEYSYDDANQINSTGFGYDACGRRTVDPRRAYTWDAADRLTRIVEGTTTTDLEYTALGEVSRRTVGGTATDYFYNYAIANHPIMAEKQGSAYRRFYIYTPDGRLLYFVDTPAAAPAAYFYHFNHLGTTLFLTNAAGAVADTYGYTPFGYLAKHIGSSDQPFTFVGEQGVRQEGDGGLYHMRARYYDSRTIQFLSRDPIWPDLENPKALNPYQYAGQNPLSFVDPSGLEYYIDIQGATLTLADAERNSTAPNGVVGKVDNKGNITWVGAGAKSMTGLPTTVDKLRSVHENIKKADLKPAEVTQPPAANLGIRESSTKPNEIIGQGPEKPIQIGYPPITYFNTQSNNGCNCNCSLLDTQAMAQSPLFYLLGPVIALLALAVIWFLVRRLIAPKS